MNMENIKEMAAKAKDEVTEFAYDHREEIAFLTSTAVTTLLGFVYGYEHGRADTTARIMHNEQRIRYAAAAATPHVDVHTDIPKK